MRSLHNLAEAYRDRGDLFEAIQLHDQAEAGRVKILGSAQRLEDVCNSSEWGGGGKATERTSVKPIASGNITPKENNDDQDRMIESLDESTARVGLTLSEMTGKG